MFFKKQGFPEEGELVLCTVTSIDYHSVFVNLDEYGKTGMIHISEVSPGRIRNIRDFVKEGKKIVCQVLRINKERNYIDLSLRRVNEIDKRKKIDQIKKEQNAEKIVEIAAGKAGIKGEELYASIAPDIMKRYGLLSDFFDEFIKDNVTLEQAGIPEKYTNPLEESIRQRIKLPEVELKGKLKIKCYSLNGMGIIKDGFKKINDIGKGSISSSYLGSGTYRIIAKAADYKEAEKKLKESTSEALAVLKKENCEVEFIKE